MVVAQLVEQLLTTPEVCGINPVIVKFYIERLLLTVLKFKKTKIKKRGREQHSVIKYQKKIFYQEIQS